VNRGLVWSGALHLAVFFAFLLGPGPRPLEWDRADAVPVDLVSLPVQLPAPVPQPPAPEPIVPEPEPAPPQEVKPQSTPPARDAPAAPKPVQAAKPKPQPPPRVFKKYAPQREDDTPSLEERLRQRLEDVSEAPAESAPAEAAASPPAAAAPSEATASVEAVNFPYEWYLNVLRTKIFAAWDPPGERLLAGHRRDVVVRFRIHRDGTITNLRIDDASGTPGLDTSAQRAIERGGPYPPLPPAYEEDWLDLGVRFTVTEGGS
jgi:TonB family protein